MSREAGRQERAAFPARLPHSFESVRDNMSVRSAFRCQAYPDEAQQVMLARTFGCVRLVWNRTLAARHARWHAEGKGTSYAQTDQALTAMKKDPGLAFLGEVSSVPLQQALRHQHTAFAAFFRAASSQVISSDLRSLATIWAQQGAWVGVTHLVAMTSNAPPDVDPVVVAGSGRQVLQVLASAGDSTARPGSCRKPPGALYVESGVWALSFPFPVRCGRTTSSRSGAPRSSVPSAEEALPWAYGCSRGTRGSPPFRHDE